MPRSGRLLVAVVFLAFPSAHLCAQGTDKISPAALARLDARMSVVWENASTRPVRVQVYAASEMGCEEVPTRLVERQLAPRQRWRIATARALCWRVISDGVRAPRATLAAPEPGEGRREVIR